MFKDATIRILRLGGRTGPAPGSRRRKLCADRDVLLYTPTLLDTLAAKLPASEPFFPRSSALSLCFCGAIPTGIATGDTCQLIPTNGLHTFRGC